MVGFFENDETDLGLMTGALGVLFVLVGGLKTVLHLQDPFARMVLCGPDISSSLMSPLAHCWGCPLALIGAVLLLFSQSGKLSA